MVINEASRSADQKVSSTLQDFSLLPIVQTTEHHVRADPRVMAEGFGVARYLHRQLASGGDDQSPRGFRWRASRDPEEVGEHCQEICGGFPGPGLSLRHDVTAGERYRQDLGLNPREIGEAEIINGAADRLREVDVVECLVREQRFCGSRFRHRPGF